MRPFDWISAYPIAHRGLHNPLGHPPENSLPAIKAGIKAGYAIEIDVQLLADGRIAVFHDRDLARLTNSCGPLTELGLDAVRSIKLKDADGKDSAYFIPSLTDVLDLIGGHRPLFIELKTRPETNIRLLCAGVRHALEGYKGPVAQMSFDPRVPKWLSDNDPDRCRGFILGKEALGNWFRRIKLAFACQRVKPDFLAVDKNFLSAPFIQNWRKAGPVATWTIKTPADAATARPLSDVLIFEQPALN